MDIHFRVISSIAVLVAVICLVMGLKQLGLVKQSYGKLFAGLVTNVTLPALIFVSLVKHRLFWSEGWLALIMLAAEILCLALAWLLGRGLKLGRPQMGAFMLAAGFGSSALLGYALINQVFPGDAAALGEAVVISEIGVGPALFTLGVVTAISFGSEHQQTKQRIRDMLGYFRSPIFASVAAGVFCSYLEIPAGNLLLDIVFKGLELLAKANTFLVTLTVGAVLELRGFKSALGLAFLVCVVKLFLKPVLVWLPTLGMDLPAWQVQVLVLEGAMPSALLTVALSAQYGCDSALASRLVFATTALSSVTILFMFSLLS